MSCIELGAYALNGSISMSLLRYHCRDVFILSCAFPLALGTQDGGAPPHSHLQTRQVSN